MELAWPAALIDPCPFSGLRLRASFVCGLDRLEVRRPASVL